jgi:hypothetical protein
MYSKYGSKRETIYEFLKEISFVRQYFNPLPPAPSSVYPLLSLPLSYYTGLA